MNIQISQMQQMAGWKENVSCSKVGILNFTSQSSIHPAPQNQVASQSKINLTYLQKKDLYASPSSTKLDIKRSTSAHHLGPPTQNQSKKHFWNMLKDEFTSANYYLLNILDLGKNVVLWIYL